jgi:hypothetical protein
MAFISQEEKKHLSVKIKEVLKEYGMKGTIGVEHHAALYVNLSEGNLDILENGFKKATEHGENCRIYGDKIKKLKHAQINNYYINENYTGKVKEFLLKLLSAMQGNGYYNETDARSDYFNIKHYTYIYVGKWDKHYKFTGKGD